MLSEKKLSFAIFAPIAIGIIGLLAFVWQGNFARLLADDYYHYFLLHNNENLFQSILEKYTLANNRYTTLFFFQLSEWIGVNWMPALMIAVWAYSIYWFLRSAFKLAEKTALASALLIVFFSVLQAPNRYQSIYWISSSVTHFFPLPLYTLLLAAVFRYAEEETTQAKRIGIFFQVFFFSYFIGGLSESSAALNFTIMVVLAFFLWLTKSERKRLYPLLALSALANLAALLTMALSPANTMRTDGTPLPLTEFVMRLLVYPSEFMLNTVKTLPLPTLATFALGFLIFGIALDKRPQQKTLIWVLVLTPLLTYLFIAASFAPNAYVFSYPDARVLFPAQFLLTAALFTGGALAGMLLLTKKLKPLATLLLIVVALYPLRGAWHTVQATQEYRDHAQVWDTRDAYIRAKADAGVRDIIVPTVNGVAGIKEFDISPRHWVNKGAAAYYGVDTISVDTTRFHYDE